jgi:predicted Holliday junction resolvase-like endonuclease
MTTFPLVLLFILAGLGILLALVVGLGVGSFVGRRKAERDMEGEIEERVRLERTDAIKRSRAVLGGQFSEQLSPYLPDFPGDPTECRFIGKPVDFISFSGASSGEVSEILFIEVKSGESKLSSVERSLRDAVREGRVRYVEYRVPGTSPAPKAVHSR